MKKNILLMCFAITLTTVSCRKPGCTDEAATNYDEKAKEDDGSCVYNYTGDLSLWYNETTSSSLVSDGITSLTVYVDDVEVGTMVPSEWATGPECYGENRFTTSIEFGNVKEKEIVYVVRDQTGATRFAAPLTIDADECNSRQVYY